jgi:hypothetical protein
MNLLLMKIFIGILLFFISIVSYSREKADTSNTKLKVNATISLNTNGIASIPAFSLDAPAIIAGVALIKNRFSYEPTLAYSFQLRPWFIDNWLNYKIVDRSAFELRTGVNISTFVAKYVVPDEEIWQAQRYFAFAITGICKISSNRSLTMAYWNDRGQDPGSIKGHFLSITGEKSEINIGKRILFSAAFQFFYIDYDGNNDGLFVAPRISSSVRNVPVSLYFQATQAIKSNISLFPGFRWNLGMSYTL